MATLTPTSDLVIPTLNKLEFWWQHHTLAGVWLRRCVIGEGAGVSVYLMQRFAGHLISCSPVISQVLCVDLGILGRKNAEVHVLCLSLDCSGSLWRRRQLAQANSSQWILHVHINDDLNCRAAYHTTAKNFAGDITYFVPGWPNIAGDVSLVALTPMAIGH